MSDDQRSRGEAQARARSSGDETAFTALAQSLEPIEPDAEVRARLLSALRGPERFTPFAAEIARAFGLTTDAALAALRATDDAGAWHIGDERGGAWLSTHELRTAKVVIARLPSKTTIARHSHSERELTFVLDGVLIEDGWRRCGPGSLIDPAIGSEHEVVVGSDGPCTVVFYPVAL